MVAFLDCVQQFKEEVEKGDTGFCLPYRSDISIIRVLLQFECKFWSALFYASEPLLLASESNKQV